MQRSIRHGAPVPRGITLPPPPACGQCGVRLDAKGACPTHGGSTFKGDSDGKRVVRMDGPARTSPVDALDARLHMAEIASRVVW